MTTRGVCCECPEGSRPRKVSRPGPRCAEHHRARKKKTSDARWALRIQETYNITPARYWQMYEDQDGVCYICQRANGRTKRLSVDHDHQCCHKPPMCGQCVRGLLCTRCNVFLGHIRDDPTAGIRIHQYLEEHTLRRIRRIGK